MSNKRNKRRKASPGTKAQKKAKEYHNKLIQRIVAKADAKAAARKKEDKKEVADTPSAPPKIQTKPSISEIENAIESLLPEVAAQNWTDHKKIAFSEVDHTEMGLRLRTGQQEAVRTSEFEGAVQVYLGFDFGTTSTKLVFNLPYEGGFPRFVVPATGSLRAEDQTFLWRTCIWLNKDDSYSLLPATDAKCLAGFKIELMQALDKLQSQGNDSVPSEPEITATAYFALMVRQALGWLKLNHDQVWDSGSVEYHVNFGFPASTVDHPQAAKGFKRCARAALALVESGQVISRSSVVQSWRVTEADQHEDWDIFPEITAAVAGFANSVKRRDGLYMIVDIGGMTVDCSTFNLYHGKNSHDRCPIFSSDVRNLGVEPLRVWLDRGKSEEDYRKVIWSRICAIVGHTFKYRNPNSDRWGNELETFVIGGGAASKPHRTALEEVSKETGRYDWCDTPLRFLPLTVENVDADGIINSDKQRLLVAIGLARPIDDIPKWIAASQVPDVELPPKSGYEGAYVGPEQM